jgi:hypothetical protein
MPPPSDKKMNNITSEATVKQEPPPANVKSEAENKSKEWIQDLPIPDDLKEIFVKENIDEKTFLQQTAADFTRMGMPFGPRKNLIKYQSDRLAGDKT